ncbi:MAG: hypothetical protein HDR80_08810 [Bacteroides sp.]|nr:hypothetical protein [Bacteroides sp.]
MEDDYKEIIELLTPRRDIKASEGLRDKVRESLDRHRRKRMARRFLLGGISLSAVAALLLLVLMPAGVTAKEVLRGAMDALRNSESLEMIVEIRTRPIENFRYIDVGEDFVTHRIRVATADSLSRWRIDKGERIAVGNGRDIYTWMPSLHLGWHMDSGETDNVLGYLANILTPYRILEAELENCINDSKAEYKAVKTGDEIILTVHAYPQGNFDNPYMFNTSVEESESVRRYVVDAYSRRLKSVSVSVMAGKHEVEVLRVASIDYASQEREICGLDAGVVFLEIEEQPAGVSGLSAEEAASTVLNAFTDWDEGILDEVMMRELADAAYREKFRGSRPISIGRSFRSGNSNSVFVPYTLELRDSTLQRHNMALQKSGSGGWIVVGGL